MLRKCATHTFESTVEANMPLDLKSKKSLVLSAFPDVFSVDFDRYGDRCVVTDNSNGRVQGFSMTYCNIWFRVVNRLSCIRSILRNELNHKISYAWERDNII